jgi:hypothetical protein
MFSNGIMCPGLKKTDPATNVSVEAFILVQYLQMTAVQLCPDFKEFDASKHIFSLFSSKIY